MSFAEYTDAIKSFVTLHREWAAPIVFVLAFGKSLAFVSLILPFWGMLVVIGTIIGASDSLNFWGIMTAAAVGAALGDWLSYWLGYHYHEQIQRMWPLNRYPNLIPQGHKFFTRWGAWAMVLGRFSGPLACQRADRRRHHTDALAALPDCQLELGVPVGVRAAFARQFRPEVVARPFVLERRRASDHVRLVGAGSRRWSCAMTAVLATCIRELPRSIRRRWRRRPGRCRCAASC